MYVWRISNLWFHVMTGESRSEALEGWKIPVPIQRTTQHELAAKSIWRNERGNVTNAFQLGCTERNASPRASWISTVSGTDYGGKKERHNIFLGIWFVCNRTRTITDALVMAQICPSFTKRQKPWWSGVTDQTVLTSWRTIRCEYNWWCQTF